MEIEFYESFVFLIPSKYSGYPMTTDQLVEYLEKELAKMGVPPFMVPPFMIPTFLEVEVECYVIRLCFMGFTCHRRLNEAASGRLIGEWSIPPAIDINEKPIDYQKILLDFKPTTSQARSYRKTYIQYMRNVFGINNDH
jgi:hypothetical protein